MSRIAWSMGRIPSSITSAVSGINATNARQFHRNVARELRRAGFTTVNEFPVPYRSRWGRRVAGRVDVVAFDQSKPICMIECDRRRPRKNSIRKLRAAGVPGMVITREDRMKRTSPHQPST